MEDHVESFNRFVIDITRKSLLTGALGAAVLTACSSDTPLVLGFLAGVVFGVLKLRFSVRQMLKWAANQCPGGAVRSYGARYVLTAVFLALVFALPQLNALTAIVGMLVPNAAIVAGQFFASLHCEAPSEGEV